MQQGKDRQESEISWSRDKVWTCAKLRWVVPGALPQALRLVSLKVRRLTAENVAARTRCRREPWADAAAFELVTRSAAAG